MPNRRWILALAAAAVATAIGCTDAPSSPTRQATPERLRGTAAFCDLVSDSCSPIQLTIEVASVAVDSGSFTSTAGDVFYASRSTRFLPPNPVVPPNPIVPTLDAWSTLVDRSANYRAYLGLMRSLPPNPIAPDVSIQFDVSALTDGSAYYLTEVTPVVVGP
jgi:hypothetical protein